FISFALLTVYHITHHLFSSLSLHCYGAHPDLHSFPTRRSSDLNTDWKMINGHPKKAGWINAIQEAQKTVQKGIGLDCPVLVMSSDRKSTRLNSSHVSISYAVFCLKKKKTKKTQQCR